MKGYLSRSAPNSVRRKRIVPYRKNTPYIIFLSETKMLGKNRELRSVSADLINPDALRQ